MAVEIVNRRKIKPIQQFEAVNGAVDTSTTPSVQYTYSDPSNGSRLATMVYPNGRAIDYPDRSGSRGLAEAARDDCRLTAPLNSGTNLNGALDNAIGRLDSISDGANSGDSGQVLEQYSYLGLSTIIARNHPQTGINLTLVGASGAIGAGGDQYVGLDQFGRVVDQNWVNSATGVSTNNLTYSYDANSNVTAENNLLDTAFSQTFTYDPLNRLNASTLGGVANQSWTLDTDYVLLRQEPKSRLSEGAAYRETSYTSNGTTQTQTANAQNQIVSISGTAGTPTYDNNGNMTTDQSGNTYVYNAWNQLVSVSNSSGQVIAQYTYNAMGYRVTESYPLGGNGVAAGTTNYIYYDNNWRAVETRTNGTANSDVTSQTVCSAAYVNAAILQDTYSAGVIQSNSRIYFLQDANWNTTAIVGLVNGSWQVTQRYVYSPYGTITVLNADWSTPPAGTPPLVNNLYQGMTLDSVTGLYYARNRNYDPSLGRWINQDLAGYINGANTYQFVLSNPVGYDDSFGLAARGRFPNQGAPNSVAERVGPDGKVTSRAFYNSKGQRYNRQDYTGDDPHGQTPTPHEHVTTFNEKGQPNGDVCKPLEPSTVDQTPGSGVKASPKGGLATDVEDIAGDISKTFETDILFPLQITILELQIGNSPPAGGPGGVVYH